MTDVAALIEQRLNKIFADYQSGQDVSPALRFATEGMMELALAAGLLTQKQLNSSLNNCYRRCFNNPAEPSLVAPRIPALMKRAPVVPTTKD